MVWNQRIRQRPHRHTYRSRLEDCPTAGSLFVVSVNETIFLHHIGGDELRIVCPVLAPRLPSDEIMTVPSKYVQPRSQRLYTKDIYASNNNNEVYFGYVVYADLA